VEPQDQQPQAEHDDHRDARRVDAADQVVVERQIQRRDVDAEVLGQCGGVQPTEVEQQPEQQ
jgi:hypothetical protein